MGRICSVTSKRPQFGNNVSHANNKTRRVFRPNIHTVNLYSDTLGRSVLLKISSAGLRTIDKYNGLDGFLEKTPARKLEGLMLTLKKRLLKKKQAEAAVEATA